MKFLNWWELYISMRMSRSSGIPVNCAMFFMTSPYSMLAPPLPRVLWTRVVKFDRMRPYLIGRDGGGFFEPGMKNGIKVIERNIVGYATLATW
jgi:hypothetical protein